MKLFKSHFWYNKRQRNGIFFLILIIVVLQFVYFFSDFSSQSMIDVSSDEILTFQKQIDSLRGIELENRKPEIFPFNPNYITDFKGEQLGMSLQEIDRLHKYRAQRKFVNSVIEFQEITKVSDSLLKRISPYFKFPDWVVKRNKSLKLVNSKDRSGGEPLSKRIEVTTDDINKATQKDFEVVNGVGTVISERIVKYRIKLQGFSFTSQLYEVWGIDKSTVNRVLKRFKIHQKPNIQQININTATFKEILKNPYINYELCKKIIEYRDEVAELQNILEIKNIDGFPIEKYDRIVLYLKAE